MSPVNSDALQADAFQRAVTDSKLYLRDVGVIRYGRKPVPEFLDCLEPMRQKATDAISQAIELAISRESELPQKQFYQLQVLAQVFDLEWCLGLLDKVENPSDAS